MSEQKEMTTLLVSQGRIDLLRDWLLSLSLLKFILFYQNGCFGNNAYSRIFPAILSAILSRLLLTG